MYVTDEYVQLTFINDELAVQISKTDHLLNAKIDNVLIHNVAHKKGPPLKRSIFNQENNFNHDKNPFFDAAAIFRCCGNF